MTINKKSKYLYEGPVKQFGSVISRKWSGVTWAPSESKALANLSYQYKKEHNMVVGTRIDLNPDYILELSAIEDDYQYYDDDMRRMIYEQAQA